MFMYSFMWNVFGVCEVYNIKFTARYSKKKTRRALEWRMEFVRCVMRIICFVQIHLGVVRLSLGPVFHIRSQRNV